MALKIKNDQLLYPLSGSFTGSLSGNATSASYALTASYAMNGGSGATFPYTGSAGITGSLTVIGPVTVTGSIYIPDNTHSIYFSGSGAPSRLTWNDVNGTLDLGLKGGNVTLQIGQEHVARVVNGSGVDLLEANYQVVRVTGAQGQRLQVVLAQADSDLNSATTLGVVTETILKNQEGFITILGQVRGINTTGTLQGETWSDGDILYLSPSTPGKLTNIKPTAPDHLVIVGYVEYAHQIHGKIFVKVDNGYELDELHNVLINTGSLTDGQLLVRSGSVWTNTKNLTGSYSITGSLIANSITSSLFGTSSFAVTASNTILQSSLLANQNVGGVTSGTTFQSGSSLETILRTILITYIPPTLSSLAVRNGGSTISTAARDVGNSFTINSASFSATADNPTSIFPLSASFTVSNADIGTITHFFGNNVLSTSNVLSIGNSYTINRATTAGSVTFTVNGRRSDTNALITGASTSISFLWRNYLRASSINIIDNASAQIVVNSAGGNDVLDSDRAWNTTGTAATNTNGNYTYIIYPASYGNLTQVILNGATPAINAFGRNDGGVSDGLPIGDFTITNTYGATVTVRVYKTNSPGVFSPTDTLAIT